MAGTLSGYYNSTYTLTSNPTTITSGGTIKVNSTGYVAGILGTSGVAWTLANYGTIEGTGFDGLGVDLQSGGTLDNAGGVIQGTGIGVLISGGAGTVTNSGAIDGTGLSGKGIALQAGGTITNTGTIDSLNNVSVTLSAGGRVDNNAGLIDGATGVLITGGAGTINNSGTISGTSGYGVLVATGSTVVNSGSILTPSSFYTVHIGDGYLSNCQSGYIGSGGVEIVGAGTVVNAGRIVDATAAGINLQAGGTIVDSGTISGRGTAIYFGGTGSNLLVLEHGYYLSGGVAASTGATNTVELAGSVGSALTVSYNGLALSHFQNVLFGTAGHDTLQVSNTSGALPVTLSGFTLTSDIVDLTGLAGGTIVGGGTVNGSDQLVVSNSTQSVTLQLDTGENYTGFIFTTGPDSGTGTDLTPCFCRGTLIRTERGELPVEDLEIGDEVVILSGEARPIKWIGRRAYDGRFVAANRAVLPIRIAAGTLEEGVPTRDLWISPEHALYIDGVLVPAGLLVNGATIRQVEKVDRLEYFHVELDSHDVILAEGALVESFVDCDNRGMFQNSNEFAALYPDDRRAPWDFCAPRLDKASAELPAIRAGLLARAEALGRVTSDPDLYLIADGAIIRAQSVADRVWRFVLPRRARALAIASRSAVPAESQAASTDERRLGVAIERIVLGGARPRVEIGHDCTALCEGFHANEGSHRWTDGMAHLPEELLRPLTSGVTVEVHLAETKPCYRADPPAGAAKAKANKRTRASMEPLGFVA